MRWSTDHRPGKELESVVPVRQKWKNQHNVQDIQIYTYIDKTKDLKKMEIDLEKSSRKQSEKGGFYPLICSLDLQYLNITIRFYWKEKEKGFVREWLKSWGKLESDDANHSLLVGKTWIGKISHKRYFQQLQPRTNLILPRKIFKFQLLCRLERLKNLTTTEERNLRFFKQTGADRLVIYAF